MRKNILQSKFSVEFFRFFGSTRKLLDGDFAENWRPYDDSSIFSTHLVNYSFSSFPRCLRFSWIPFFLGSSSSTKRAQIAQALLLQKTPNKYFLRELGKEQNTVASYKPHTDNTSRSFSHVFEKGERNWVFTPKLIRSSFQKHSRWSKRSGTGAPTQEMLLRKGSGCSRKMAIFVFFSVLLGEDTAASVIAYQNALRLRKKTFDTMG